MARRLLTLLLGAAAIVLGCKSTQSTTTRAADAPAAVHLEVPVDEAAAAPATQPAAVAAPAAPTTQPAIDPIGEPPAQPAAAQQPQTPSEEKPKSAAELFDAALEHLSQDQAPESLSSLAAEERDLLSTVITAISSFRHSLADQHALMSTRTAPLVALSEQLKAQTPLAIPTLALCRSVTQFGVYDPFDPPRFTAGQETPVIIYCELDNFHSSIASDGRWETKLSYEAVLYTDSDTSISVISKKPTSIVDRCRNRRRDFFLADRMAIPSSLPVGKYVFKVTVVDQVGNHVAEKALPILVAPN